MWLNPWGHEESGRVRYDSTTEQLQQLGVLTAPELCGMIYFFQGGESSLIYFTKTPEQSKS